MRIYYPNFFFLRNMNHSLLNVSIGFKGTYFYILFKTFNFPQMDAMVDLSLQWVQNPNGYF